MQPRSVPLAPWVYPVDLADVDGVWATAVASLDDAARAGTIDRLVEWLAPFTENAYVARLRGILGESHGTRG